MNISANNDTLKVVKEIEDYFYSKCDDFYFPALINEGQIFSDNGNKDLYLKVVAVKKNQNVLGTWLVSNFSSEIENNAFNFLVHYSYNHNTLIGLHPSLLTYHPISFIEQKSEEFFDMDYYDETRLNNFKIFKQVDKNILMFFQTIDFMTDIVNSADEKYDLYFDCEFRERIDGLNPDILGDKQIKDGFVNLIYDNNKALDLSKDHIKKIYWLRFSRKIDLSKMKCAINASIKKTIDKRYKVVDLEDRKFRSLNLSNYDDDINAGILMFSLDAINVLKKYYYFYALELLPKTEDLRECLVDYLEDRICFWEGEFNSKLPYEIKEELLKFNLSDKCDNFISPAMFDWQLMAMWDVKDKLLPNQKLARKVMEKDINKAKENMIDFFPPQNLTEFSSFVEKFLLTFDISIGSLPISLENKQKLGLIINKNYHFNNYKDLYNDYQGLCLLFLKVVFNE